MFATTSPARYDSATYCPTSHGCCQARHGKKASASGETKKDGDDKDKGGKKDTRKAKKAGKNASSDNDKKKGGRGGGSSDSKTDDYVPRDVREKLPASVQRTNYEQSEC